MLTLTGTGVARLRRLSCSPQTSPGTPFGRSPDSRIVLLATTFPLPTHMGRKLQQWQRSAFVPDHSGGGRVGFAPTSLLRPSRRLAYYRVHRRAVKSQAKPPPSHTRYPCLRHKQGGRPEPFLTRLNVESLVARTKRSRIIAGAVARPTGEMSGAVYHEARRLSLSFPRACPACARNPGFPRHGGQRDRDSSRGSPARE